jgi:hypothetical protein
MVSALPAVLALCYVISVVAILTTILRYVCLRSLSFNIRNTPCVFPASDSILLLHLSCRTLPQRRRPPLYLCLLACGGSYGFADTSSAPWRIRFPQHIRPFVYVAEDRRRRHLDGSRDGKMGVMTVSPSYLPTVVGLQRLCRGCLNSAAPAICPLSSFSTILCRCLSRYHLQLKLTSHF